MLPDDHRTAERRSLAFHQLVAERLDEALLAAARVRVRGWRESHVHPHWTRRWEEILSGSVAEVADAIVAQDAEATALRQTTPFAGALAPAERWQLIREVR